MVVKNKTGTLTPAGDLMDGITVASFESLLESINVALADSLNLIADAPGQLLEAIKYSLLAPGKRLRPRLVVLACAAAGGDTARALPAGCAVEMIHAYSLIHDDLPAMDDDDLRRGAATCHRQFGEATAILAGDALQALAFQVLAHQYAPTTGAACCRELAIAAGAIGMVGGQSLDLSWENRQDGRIGDLESIHAAKTGALFCACLRIGGWVAQGEQSGGPDPAMMAALTQFGKAFGLMFQITDDLLDVEGSIESAGKRLGKDQEKGKLTYPGLLGVEESRRRAQELCQEAVSAVESLGPAAAPLQRLAAVVCNRDR